MADKFETRISDKTENSFRANIFKNGKRVNSITVNSLSALMEAYAPDKKEEAIKDIKQQPFFKG